MLGGADSVTLLISVVDRDSPDALPIELSGGIGGPAVSMFVWPDHRGGYGPRFGGWGSGDDYGWGGWYGGGVAGPSPALLNTDDALPPVAAPSTLSWNLVVCDFFLRRQAQAP